MAEIQVTIACKKGDNKAFKAVEGDVWYNVNADVVATLTNIAKGEVVIITAEKKGASQYVTSLRKADSPSSAVAPAGTEEHPCAVCGKIIKKGTFKVCFMCNKKGLKAPVASPEPSNTPEVTATINKTGKATYYDNPEKTAQIQRGNALNAAASVASGQQFLDVETGKPDLETAKQFTIALASAFLNWLRME